MLETGDGEESRDQVARELVLYDPRPARTLDSNEAAVRRKRENKPWGGGVAMTAKRWW